MKNLEQIIFMSLVNKLLEIRYIYNTKNNLKYIKIDGFAVYKQRTY